MIVECPHEQDVTDAIATGRWPERCEQDLRDHVAGCGTCTDLAEILAPVSSAWDASHAEGSVPPSALVWWRAQLLARQEAAAVAAKPVSVVQRLGLATAIAFAAGVLAALSPWLIGSLPGLRETAAGMFTVNLPELPAVSATWLVVAIAACAALALTTIAVYVVVGED